MMSEKLSIYRMYIWKREGGREKETKPHRATRFVRIMSRLIH